MCQPFHKSTLDTVVSTLSKTKKNVIENRRSIQESTRCMQQLFTKAQPNLLSFDFIEGFDPAPNEPHPPIKSCLKEGLVLVFQIEWNTWLNDKKLFHTSLVHEIMNTYKTRNSIHSFSTKRVECDLSHDCIK